MSTSQKVIYCFGLLSLFSIILVNSLSCGVFSDNEEQILSGVRDNIHELESEIETLNKNLSALEEKLPNGDDYYISLINEIALLRVEFLNIRRKIDFDNLNTIPNQLMDYKDELERLNTNIESLYEAYGDIETLTTFLEENREALHSIAEFLEEFSGND